MHLDHFFLRCVNILLFLISFRNIFLIFLLQEKRERDSSNNNNNHHQSVLCAKLVIDIKKKENRMRRVVYEWTNATRFFFSFDYVEDVLCGENMTMTTMKKIIIYIYEWFANFWYDWDFTCISLIISVCLDRCIQFFYMLNAFGYPTTVQNFSSLAHTVAEL
jgi:hypothetical protein